MGSKKLNDSWKDLRLTMRHAALDHVERHVPRVNALPPEPVDPERVVTLVKQIVEDLAEHSAEGEESPVLRLVKKVFRPNASEKSRKRLVKSFDHYLATWGAENKTG